ncbi:unnamed protein product [Angiostrongylus costaricensis]|uniref:Methyltransf_11 domain-containing protein n=1 Tax=Angiostrongylus costaricensis TaxID=334426 RepID=A0A0R3PC39_ANGCS|nr:unnamed protein product [Angiostrongylus costaricensis]
MENNHKYASREYWDERFTEEGSFEWLVEFDAFKHLVLPKLKWSSRILHVGCGTSQMSMQLYRMGYKNITNVDFSKVVVDNGRTLHPEMKWICEDIRSLASIPSDAFDVVLEKATIESMLVGEKSAWNPSDNALRIVDDVLKSVARVLTSDGMNCCNSDEGNVVEKDFAGIFVSVSFTQPHFRVPAFLRFPGWSISVNKIGEFFHYFVYIMQCGRETSQDVRKRFANIAPDWCRVLR